MKAIFLFDIKSYGKRWGFWLMLTLTIVFGIFGGQNARFSVSDELFDNSPYQISFITTLISLITLLFSTLFAAQLLFKESDSNFSQVLFSIALSKGSFVAGRYLALLSLSFGLTLLLLISFFIGHGMANPAGKVTGFNLAWYIAPFIYFGLINTLFVTAVLSAVAWLGRNKLLVYVSGLMLYIVYMIMLIYSGSPMMAQSMPQSERSQLIAGIIDPFGFSAFFHQTAQWSVPQRNSEVVSLTGIFLYNRLGIVLLSIGLLFICAKKFSIDTAKRKKTQARSFEEPATVSTYHPVATSNTTNAQWQALLSFIKMDLTWILKSIPFILTAMAMLFMVGMELYAEIEKGIRIPQKYANSGLMVSTIIQNFHALGMIALIYYAHELFWRSRNANFHLIENSTSNTRTSFYAKCLSLTIVLVLFTLLMIGEGVLFQLAYNYLHIEWWVYADVFLFNTFPLILLCVTIMLIQKWINAKYAGLTATIVFVVLFATTLGKKLISYPLLKFLQPFAGDHSDMNGFGSYTCAYAERLLFGAILIGLLVALSQTKKTGSKLMPIMIALFLIAGTIFTGTDLISNYQPQNKNAGLQAQANYERDYRKYQNLPQPTITDVTTTIDLDPEQNAYRICGKYILVNRSAAKISSILLGLDDDMKVARMTYRNGKESVDVRQHQQLIQLQNPLLPGDTATLNFDISYKWYAVNGHKSFNAIVDNGAFMRISRYYPQLGYNAGMEIQDEHQRKLFNLGKATVIRSLDAPKSAIDDFINLDMTVSTSANQTAIGVGELFKAWKDKGRNYFRYRTGSPIPFRFAVSSAKYAIKQELYRGKRFEIYYHPAHPENVDHLLKNAKLTMDYCEKNFGSYPFKTIRFAEISSFTKGFAATAYPATIYMAEDIIFHANIKGDRQQDVVNELAGHELSHLWWGNSQIDPDDREGSPLLTETLAMYTEMMLLKQMYGKEKMLDRLRMHLGIYLDERGFNTERPLYKMLGEDTHLSYSKGAVVMYQLSQLVGEDKMNLALRNFLAKLKYPNAKPISTDLLDEFYNVADKKDHQRIRDMFTKTGGLTTQDLK
ncbi:ABC transporter permease/M1 family aminopeptidase [Mucilaginibacter myungsuensis]|uniref:Aminopeptidase n=1 Tax=Mucilaginibacter myungsuensis TaxID=649104 RepID=A0A929L607_9SPHI|nr:M1 family aminopeptidase [Mucilaginibacter myungsuensis]MBE9663841.1 aminopeptidase [Mucilaginibacter myungsuensis]MDN3598444.1 M1 family aminopeptidase [Mucilaginibacter myungsuensis]